MNTVSYHFADGVCGYFELPTACARRILPAHLQPLEPRPGASVLAVTAFDFWQSPIGPYGEAVMSIVTAPLVVAGRAFPKAALYPYLVATTTRAARDHAISRWRLPHWMEDVAIFVTRGARAAEVRVATGGTEVLAMRVTDHPTRASVRDRYQVFVQDQHMADVIMTGEASEHEEGTGHIELREHPFHAHLSVDEVEPAPFREQWIRGGTETFHPLEPVPGTRHSKVRAA